MLVDDGDPVCRRIGLAIRGFHRKADRAIEIAKLEEEFQVPRTSDGVSHRVGTVEARITPVKQCGCILYMTQQISRVREPLPLVDQENP